MPFDLIEKFKEKLPGWKARLQSASVRSSYAMITACALWPVAAAAQAGSLPVAASLAVQLGGSVGANLIANYIQKWKDEADGARQLEALPKDDPLREHLDQLLQRLDAFAAAREALPPADNPWFQETLREELTRLGNLHKFEVQLSAKQSGSGGQAVGQHNVAAGERGVAVGGDFHGNVTIN